MCHSLFFITKNFCALHYNELAQKTHEKPQETDFLWALSFRLTSFVRKRRNFISIMKECLKAWDHPSLRVSRWTSLVSKPHRSSRITSHTFLELYHGVPIWSSCSWGPLCTNRDLLSGNIIGVLYKLLGENKRTFTKTNILIYCL